RGRPGHQGFFPTAGSPIRGRSSVFRVGVTGGLIDARVDLIDEEGDILASAQVAPPEMSPPRYPILYGEVIVPEVPFRVVLRGVDDDGTHRLLQRADDAFEFPQTLQLRLVPVQGILFDNVDNPLN